MEQLSEKTLESKVYSRSVELNRDLNQVRKSWTNRSEAWAKAQYEKINSYEPGRAVGYGTNSNSVYVDLRYIDGIPGNEWDRTNPSTSLYYVIKFWIGEIRRQPNFKPKWRVSSVVVQQKSGIIDANTNFSIIDFDEMQMDNIDNIKTEFNQQVFERYKEYLTVDQLSELKNELNSI